MEVFPPGHLHQELSGKIASFSKILWTKVFCEGVKGKIKTLTKRERGL